MDNNELKKRVEESVLNFLNDITNWEDIKSPDKFEVPVDDKGHNKFEIPISEPKIFTKVDDKSANVFRLDKKDN